MKRQPGVQRRGPRLWLGPPVGHKAGARNARTSGFVIRRNKWLCVCAPHEAA